MEGGEHIIYYFDTLPAPPPTSTFAASTITCLYHGLVLKTGEDRGVHTSKAKHVTQSTQIHVFGTYTLSLIIRWQCTVPARH